MKTTVSLLCALALLATATLRLAAADGPPELLSYQGYLVDANGAPLGVDGSGNPLPSNYDVTFSIFDASTGGTLLWREQQTITVDAGYFSVLLGEGTVVGSDPRPNLSTVFTGIGADERFVGVAVRFEAGGAFADILPRLRLLTSPYAFSASQARSVVNPDGQALITAEGSDVTISGNLTTTQPITVPSISGSGANLTNINANNITTGTLSSARLPGIPASQITSGTLSDVRLSGNVPRLNAAQTFSQLNRFSGGIRMNDNRVFFRAGSDENHGLGWAASFDGLGIDGPVLWGHSGGALGTGFMSTQRAALRWNNNRQVFIPNRLNVGTPGWSSTDFGMRVSNDTTQFTLSGTTFRFFNERFQQVAPAPQTVTSQPGLQESISPSFEWLFGSNSRMRLSSGGSLSIDGSLSQGSDRDRKENVVALYPSDVLEKVAGLPLYEWSYIDGMGARHIGPMAQDFHAAFGLGSSDTRLAPSDVAGVALSAIQGLHGTVKAQEAEIAELKQTVADLQAAVAALLEAQASGQ